MPTDREERAIAGGRGKWSQAGVPHLGWTCVDIEDLGEPSQVCGMCESQEIRYVHFMQHDAYPHVLEVGCVCAGNMEGDLLAARRRDATMLSRAGRRARWLSRSWRVSVKGNEWIRSDGFRVIVRMVDGHWAVSIASEEDNSVRHGRRRYRTSAQAKLAAFDFISRLLAADARSGGGHA